MPKLIEEMTTCPVCGKNFFPATLHVYKIKIKYQWIIVCSWGCVRKWEKQQEEEKQKRKKKKGGEG